MNSLTLVTHQNQYKIKLTRLALIFRVLYPLSLIPHYCGCSKCTKKSQSISTYLTFNIILEYVLLTSLIPSNRITMTWNLQIGNFFRNLATIFLKKSSRANYLDCCRDLGKCNVLKCFFTFLITNYWWIYSARLGSLCYLYDLTQIVKDFYGVTGAKQGLVSLRELALQCQIFEFLVCKWVFRCCSFIMSQ